MEFVTKVDVELQASEIEVLLRCLNPYFHELKDCINEAVKSGANCDAHFYAMKLVEAYEVQSTLMAAQAEIEVENEERLNKYRNENI